MLSTYDYDDATVEELLDFVVANAKRMRELSLRMVLKVADLRASLPAKWRAVVEVTCMRNSR